MGRPKELAGRESEVLAAWQAGATLGELMEQFGISRTPIRRIVNGAGLTREPHRPSAVPRDLEPEVVAAYQGSVWAVARQFGTHRTVVRRILDRHGVKVDTRVGRRSGNVQGPSPLGTSRHSEEGDAHEDRPRP
jgi:hypothetical protein